MRTYYEPHPLASARDAFMVPLVMESQAPLTRYAIRPDAEGFSVYDVWTGQPLQLAMVAQTGLSAEDAEHTARLFNERAERGERVIRQ